MSRRPLIVLLVLVATSAAAQIPPRTISAPKSEIVDDFLSYIHGLIYQNRELRIDGDTLRERFPEFDTPRHTPFNDISYMTRVRSIDESRRYRVHISVDFVVPLEHNVEAVNFLGIRPVNLVGSRKIVASEVRVRPEAVAFRHLAEYSEIRDLAVLTITEGFMRIDFADWLDFLLGALVDDVDVKLVAIGNYEGTWYGMLGGTNAGGSAKTGVLDLSNNQFLLQPPELLSQLAVELVDGALGE